MANEPATLSICTTCRDGREVAAGTRGGARLGAAVLAHMWGAATAAVTLRGVKCMSQCKRPCVVSLSKKDSFTYVFGDLDPEQTHHIDALLELVAEYNTAPEGFLERKDRPEAMRANILGRFPPIGMTSRLVIPFESIAAK